MQVFPNPCSDVTRLRYLIHDIGYLISDLYSISGVKIKELINEVKMPGEYELEIDVRDLPTGIYFIRMQAGETVVTKKLIVR